jgi:hypothetical protein
MISFHGVVDGVHVRLAAGNGTINALLDSKDARAAAAESGISKEEILECGLRMELVLVMIPIHSRSSSAAGACARVNELQHSMQWVPCVLHCQDQLVNELQHSTGSFPFALHFQDLSGSVRWRRSSRCIHMQHPWM